MISQENNYSNQANADYSAVRSKVENQSRGFNVADDEVTLSSNNDYPATGNQNISSILSQIKDDGPAYNGSSRKESVVNFRTNKASSYTENQQYGAESNVDAQTQTQVPAGMAPNNTVAGVPAVNAKNISGLQVFLLAAVIIVATFFLYRLDMRTNQLEASLSMYEASIQSSIVSNRNELSPGIVSINATLEKVKNDIEFIKTSGAVKPGIKHGEGTLISAASSDIDNTSADKAGMDAHEDEPGQLPVKLATANSKPADSNTDIITQNSVAKISKRKTSSAKTSSSSKKASVADNVAVSKQVVTSGWIVNLASFTSKDRTQGKVKQLLSLGYTPLIEEAVVNDKRVYRLIVDGFEERTQAELFVQIVAQQFGMTGGWIRKS